VEEAWNKRVDAEVEILVDGMVDLVGLASIGNKDKYRISQEGFQAESRAESMVRPFLLLVIFFSLNPLLMIDLKLSYVRIGQSGELVIEHYAFDEAVVVTFG